MGLRRPPEPRHNASARERFSLVLRPALASRSRWCDRSIPDVSFSVGTQRHIEETAALFGTHVAETILASGHVRPHQQAGHMIASDPIRHCHSSCKPGAVHIWVPGLAALARDTRGAPFDAARLFPSSRCQTAQSSSFPRRVLRPGFVLVIASIPERRGGRSADRRTISFVAFVRRDCPHQRGAARPMTRDARLSALHRGGFRPGAALPSPALPPDPCSELLAARSSCLAGGVPDLPSPRLRAAAAGRHSPLRLQDRLRRRPSMSEDANPTTASLRSQQISSYRSQ